MVKLSDLKIDYNFKKSNTERKERFKKKIKIFFFSDSVLRFKFSSV